MNQAAVKKHGSNQPPILVVEKDGRAITFTEAKGRNPIEAPEEIQAAGFSRLNRKHELDGKEKEIQAEQDCRNRRIESGNRGEFSCGSGEREAEVGATFVATSGVNTDKSIACGTEFWAGLLLAPTAENTTRGTFPALEAPLPTIGKSQCASLQIVGHFEFRLIASRAMKSRIAPLVPCGGI